MATAQDFAREYEKALSAAVTKKPGDYAYGPERVPDVAKKMIDAYKIGMASASSAMRTAARKCGIAPTLSAVRALLNSHS